MQNVRFGFIEKKKCGGQKMNMIKGSIDIKPYQNLTEKEAQEIADVYFKSSIEMAIASLQSGLAHAKRINNLKLAALLEKYIETFLAMWNEREAKNEQ